MDEGVVTHVQRGEGFACIFSNSITELVVTSHDEAAIIKIQGIIDRKFGVIAIEVRSQVWGLYAIAKEEGIALFLIPHNRSVHCRWQYGEPHPCIGPPYQLTGIQCRGFCHSLLQSCL